MKKFLLGFVVGLFFSAASAGVAAVLAGDDGYASGWSVTKDGEEICSDPYVYVDTKQVECD